MTTSILFHDGAPGVLVAFLLCFLYYSKYMIIMVLSILGLDLVLAALFGVVLLAGC